MLNIWKYDDTEYCAIQSNSQSSYSRYSLLHRLRTFNYASYAPASPQNMRTASSSALFTLCCCFPMGWCELLNAFLARWREIGECRGCEQKKVQPISLWSGFSHLNHAKVVYIFSHNKSLQLILTMWITGESTVAIRRATC